jgi:hypothetical protein
VSKTPPKPFDDDKASRDAVEAADADADGALPARI